MKIIISTLISCIVLFCSFSCSEPDPLYIYGNIVGKVTEEGSNKAIEGVTIEINGVEQSVKTGNNGMFKIEKLPANNYILYVTKDGYVADSKNITVVAKQTIQSDFSLLKNLPEAVPSEVFLTTTKTSIPIELKNTRSTIMDFMVQTSEPWISVLPSYGTIASKNSKIIKILTDFSQIEYGEYTESIIINVGQSSLNIPIQISYYKPSYIEITSPQIGKVYSMGDVLPIIWNSNIEGTVKIELVRNGTVQQSIVPSIKNNISNYSWSIPSLSIDTYQVLVTSNETPEISDLSEGFYLKEGPTPPIVSTGEVTSITSSSITVSGLIEDFGKTYNNLTQYGHVYSEINPNPTISDYKHNHGTAVQLISYISNLNNLKPNTRYYIRSYAENPKGVTYGSTISVTTKNQDGSEYWEPTEPDETGAVDLGLSVKWATYNVGATSPEEYGNYYAWGEINPKNDYTKATYDFAKKDKYGYYEYILPEGLTNISSTKYDVATSSWGNNWRIPTRQEILELSEKATTVRTSYKNVQGVRIIGPNGNSFFLPNAGYRNESGLVKQVCMYRTSSMAEEELDYPYIYEVTGSGIYMSKYIGSYYGLPIRAVRD